MLLVMDVGNTEIVLGLFEGKEQVVDWKIATDQNKTPDEYGIIIQALLRSHAQRQRGVRRGSVDLSPESDAPVMFASKLTIEAIILSSVVPTLTNIFTTMSRTFFGLDPMVVGPGIRTGLSIVFENPKEVGADRVVNAVAAVKLYGAPVIVVDFGTATTFCAINEKREYLGGVIFPGLEIAAEALFLRASKLPRVGLEPPSRVIGKNTVNSIQSGLIYGYTDLVDGLIRRISTEMRCEPGVIATGGLSGIIAPYSRQIKLTNPVLTLEGLRIIYELNAPDR
ncbi:MAG: type III pantothenate kinase [Firmicutes bacterium]|nr:type III pantothenate kinase [Bacillota bacterium]